MGRYDVLLTKEGPPQEPKPAQPVRKAAAQPPLPPPAAQPHPQPPTQPTSQSTEQSTKVVDRPKAFYITQQLDRQLDVAVRYFQERHGIRKADRSTVVNAILDRPANWTEETLDRLVSRVIGHLTSRLTEQ